MRDGQFKTWVDHPFSVDMPLSGWILFFLLFLIVASLWGSTINLMKKAVE